ncbi:MAG: RNB domain-containing ribonuclease, partial [Oscillospiraceae bacterium]|nr:RNB domain-containing ribonuclease [Oscillospiraceae bacterium]
MSLKDKIVKDLTKRPQRLKQLKDKYGNEKKVTLIINTLQKKGKVSFSDGFYSLKEKETEISTIKNTANGVKCTLVKLSGNFGFAAPEDGTEDFFIPGRCLKGAMPRDVILVKQFETPRKEGSREGEVVEILEENNNFVGVCGRENGRLVCYPDIAPNTPVYIKKSADGGAKIGEKIAIVILERGKRHDDHRAGVSMRFGDADSAKRCAKAILYGAGIEKNFPQKVKAEAKRLENAAVSPEDMKGRLDLRKEVIFTIDAATTKDIDDAISAKRTANGYEVGVHIADVSHYVTECSALNAEAFKRGTSVYYADSVVPMLPRQLSNGICSLNPDVDRL